MPEVQTMDDLKAVYCDLTAKEKQAQTAKDAALEAEAEAIGKLANANNQRQQLVADYQARETEAIEDYLANPTPALVDLAQWSAKPAQAVAFTERLADHIQHEVIPANILRRVVANVALLKIQAEIADLGVAIADRQLSDALAPVEALHGTVGAGSGAAIFAPTSALLEIMRSIRDHAWHVYFGANTFLTEERARQEKARSARTATGIITRAQVLNTVPR